VEYKVPTDFLVYLSISIAFHNGESFHVPLKKLNVKRNNFVAS